LNVASGAFASRGAGHGLRAGCGTNEGEGDSKSGEEGVLHLENSEKGCCALYAETGESKGSRFKFWSWFT